MDEKFQKLRTILASKALVSEQEVHLESDIFADLDIDSLCLIEAFLEIEQGFQVKLHPASLSRDTFNTPKKLLALIAQS